MENEFELIAKTFQGLEDLLAQELAEIGANNIKKGRRVVHFTGDTETMYRANYMLRTAIRILKPLKHFSASNADEVYDTVRNYEWRNILDLKTTFAVDSVVYSENFSYSKFVAYKVKDAIVDYFRENCGKRPNISIANPDIRFHIHISDDDCTLSLDSSGESLHKRGYRVESVDAPINEVLAAGIVKLTGWNGECDYIDPMCGSATIPIEACMMARNIAPGKFRKEFAFQKWADYSESLFLSIKDSCTAQERPFEHRMYAYDVDANAVKAAKANIIAAELDEDFVVDRRDFREFKQPAEKAIMVINPPYGVRIKSDSALPLLYKAIGERLKHQFTGNEAWIICNSEELFQNIGLKPSIKIPLFNGSLDCQLQKYQIFSGKFNEFRHEGNDIKTDRERRQMADPHRFKVHREFKKRLDEDEQADYGDIPDYVIRKHREFEENQRRKERRAARDQRRSSHPDNDGERSFGPNTRKPYATGGRRFEHNGNRSERQDRRNFHDSKSYGHNSSHDGSRGDFRGKSGGGFRKGGERKGYKG